MKDLIKRLPLEIVSHIISYTYQFQARDLLDDIVNYQEIKCDLFKLYPLHYRDWLINDMFAYANHYKATMYGYVDSFYDMVLRRKRLKTRESIHGYLKQLNKKKVDTQINVFLGMFTIHEREDLLMDLCNQIQWFDEWY